MGEWKVAAWRYETTSEERLLVQAGQDALLIEDFREA
jgi:hypothetical protein